MVRGHRRGTQQQVVRGYRRGSLYFKILGQLLSYKSVSVANRFLVYICININKILGMIILKINMKYLEKIQKEGMV